MTFRQLRFWTFGRSDFVDCFIRTDSLDEERLTSESASLNEWTCGADG